MIMNKTTTKIFKNKNILITGGTGFLGLHLTKTILKSKPKSIRLFSRDEVKHYKAQEILKHNPKIRNFIGDIRDYRRLVKATRNVQIVIHAAALKRIDLLEYNTEEAIKTNVYGVLNVVNACLKNRVQKAVFVSSDKACSPVNTYGACKFIGERIFSETNYNKGDIPTIFTTVRYGNVLESTGSVIPFFVAKIKKGEEIPLTDPQMTRFIISPEQSVDLIFDAIRYAKGGEVFVPKLNSFKIVDLIEILKEKYKAKNRIKIIGIRPGEKIHELLINGSEIPRTVKFRNLYLINSCIRKHLKVNNSILTKEYSSKDFLISKNKVKKIFQKLKLL